MSAFDARVDLLQDTTFYSSLGVIEREAFMEKVNVGDITDYAMVVDYGIYEVLLIIENDRELCNYLIERAVFFFENLEKYEFDLIVGYIYKNKQNLKSEDISLLSKQSEGLSFVTKELLFDLEGIEIRHLDEDGVFHKKFNINAVLLELESEESKKQEKK